MCLVLHATERLESDPPAAAYDVIRSVCVKLNEELQDQQECGCNNTQF